MQNLISTDRQTNFVWAYLSCLGEWQAQAYYSWRCLHSRSLQSHHCLSVKKLFILHRNLIIKLQYFNPLWLFFLSLFPSKVNTCIWKWCLHVLAKELYNICHNYQGYIDMYMYLTLLGANKTHYVSCLIIYFPRMLTIFVITGKSIHLCDF